MSQLNQQMNLYYGTGAAEVKAKVLATGETWLPAVSEMFKRFDVSQPFLGMQIYKQQAAGDLYRSQFLSAWNNTKHATSGGKTMDLLLCPVAPVLSYPHNFLAWWGYTLIFNILDLPSLIMPIKGFKVDPKKDVQKPLGAVENLWNKENHSIWDPDTYKAMPVCIQMVGRQVHDEETIAFGKVVDSVIN